MPFIGREYPNEKISVTDRVVALICSVSILLIPEEIFQESGIFDGVKLISDIQLRSINYSETNFECEIASCMFKKLGYQ